MYVQIQNTNMNENVKCYPIWCSLLKYAIYDTLKIIEDFKCSKNRLTHYALMAL